MKIKVLSFKFDSQEKTKGAIVRNSEWRLEIGVPSLGALEQVKYISDVGLPLVPHPSLEELQQSLEISLRDLKEGFVQLFYGKEVVGFAFLNPIPESHQVVIVGSVLPLFRNRGGAQRMIDFLSKIALQNDYETLESFYFESEKQAERFLTKSGFQEEERIFWSEWNLLAEPQNYLKENYNILCAQGVQFLSGMEFSMQMEDWERKWWRHVMDVVPDIPSKTPLKIFSFESWRKYLHPPFLDRSLSVVALKENKIVGLIFLGSAHSGTANINHTSVARSHRRKGLCLALKFAMRKMALQNGIERLKTQNHQNNPMFHINLKMGFSHVATQITMIKSLKD